MVEILTYLFVTSVIIDYLTYILDTSRRRSNRQIIVQNLFCEDDEEQFLIPKPLWYEIIHQANGYVFWGSVIGFGILILFMFIKTYVI